VSFTFRVADIATKVVCDDRAIVSTMSGAGSRFLVGDGAADTTIRVQAATRLTHPDAEKLFDSGQVWQLYRDRDEFIFTFTSPVLGPTPYRVARFNSSFTSGNVWLRDACLGGDYPTKPLDYPLDELLMINLLARGRGVEVHACGVIDTDGAAYLFAGQSGAGKSTIARLWSRAGATILSDDRLVLRIREGRVWVYGTPWHGEEQFGCPDAAPLSRIFFLVHAPENRATRMTEAGAAALLFARAFPPFYDKAGLDFTLSFLGDVMNRVPASQLAFVPDSGVVGFVRTQP
jgi:hypothetical protein